MTPPHYKLIIDSSALLWNSVPDIRYYKESERVIKNKKRRLLVRNVLNFWRHQRLTSFVIAEKTKRNITNTIMLPWSSSPGKLSYGLYSKYVEGSAANIRMPHQKELANENRR